MLLSDYQWSRNPRGLHCTSIYQSPPDYAHWINPHMGWAKLMAAGFEYMRAIPVFLENNITPIVRLYVGAYGAGPFDRKLQEIVRTFAGAGVKWFEFYNEPNLGVEWANNFNPSWQDVPNVIKPLMDNWMNFAEYCVSLGCYPGFIPLAESVDGRYAAIPWMNAFLTYLANNHFDRFRTVLANGGWCSTHPYIFNHYYQEGAGGRPRPPDSQVGTEGGWHFEYPYDPIAQSSDPGRTVYGGTAQTPYGDPNGLTAMGIVFNDRCGQIFGANNVPVVGTEGGIYPFRDGSFQPDTRYPPYNERSQAEGTLAMFNWSATQAPPWFFGVTLWKEDDYYIPDPVHCMNRLGEVSPVYKDVPAIEVMSGTMEPPGTPVPIGPGPIHGQADFHMVILGPGLETRWFFDTAQAYWNMFRPMVTTHDELIELIPSSKSLAVTVLTSPEMVDLMRQQIAERYVNVWFDLIVAESLQQVSETFNTRVRLNRRFG
jgi:hypothetical protein